MAKKLAAESAPARPLTVAQRMVAEAKPAIAPAPVRVRNCPECLQALANQSLGQGAAHVCTLCAAIFWMDERGVARLMKTDEWHKVCCVAGHNHLWDERERVLESQTSPQAKHG